MVRARIARYRFARVETDSTAFGLRRSGPFELF